jgi:hypothetical protein
MAHSKPEIARDRIRGMQAAAVSHQQARQALIQRRALRRAERAERKTRRLAQAAQKLRARIAELEAGQ